MAEKKDYNCDLCGKPAKDIPSPEAGVSLLFETDCSGDHNATISPLGAVKGMVGTRDERTGEFNKVVNICERCRLAISNPKAKKEWCRE